MSGHASLDTINRTHSSSRHTAHGRFVWALHMAKLPHEGWSHTRTRTPEEILPPFPAPPALEVSTAQLGGLTFLLQESLHRSKRPSPPQPARQLSEPSDFPLPPPRSCVALSIDEPRTSSSKNPRGLSAPEPPPAVNRRRDNTSRSSSRGKSFASCRVAFAQPNKARENDSSPAGNTGKTFPSLFFGSANSWRHQRTHVKLGADKKNNHRLWT